MTSSPAPGRTASTSATSSSATTPRTPATRAFLAGPTGAHHGDLGHSSTAMFPDERERGIYDVDAPRPSHDHRRTRPATSTSDNELIVGLQTDAPLKRAIMPNGGWRMVEDALRDLRLRARPDACSEIFTHLPQDAQRRRLRRLPARGARRPHGAHHHRPARRLRPRPDHRRLPPRRPLRRRPADRRARSAERADAGRGAPSSDDVIRDREELAEQIRALGELDADGRRATATTSPARPATAREAVQWLYFAYLAAVKEQNGAAMSLGRTSTFLDVYLQRDLAAGRLTETRGPGADRRPRDQAADRAVPAHARVRRAVLRRPDLGHRVASAASARTAARSSPARRSGSCRRSTTSARRPEPNLTVLWIDRLPERVQAVLRAGLDRHRRRSSTRPTS